MTISTSYSARREAARNLFELLEFRGVGAEQLAQRIVDLEAERTERREHHQNNENERGNAWGNEGNKPDTLDSERKLLMPGLRPQWVVGHSAGHAKISEFRSGAPAPNPRAKPKSTHNYFRPPPQGEQDFLPKPPCFTPF